jgi:hypothetical protein
MYLAPADHAPIAGFSEMASFTPFEERQACALPPPARHTAPICW